MRIVTAAAFTVSSLLLSSSALATPKVITSIQPLHSLVASIMKGVGEPELIVSGAASPHDFSLKPSQAQSLQDSDIVFWVGPRLESFLKKPLETIAADARSVEMVDLPDIKLLPVREGGGFEKHDHDHGHDDHEDHDHEKHDEHADHKDHDHEKHADHKDHDHDHDKKEHEGHDHDEDHKEHADHDHDHEKHEEHDHDDEKHSDHDHDEKHEEHSDHAEHDHDEKDAHIWLSTKNVIVMAKAIGKELGEVDPENADTYAKNTENLVAELSSLDTKVSAKMEPLTNAAFMVFHDAYQYFEDQYGLSAVGSITLNPELKPGAKRVRELQEKITSQNTACIFSEPQFDKKIVATLAEGTNVRVVTLDPLGATIEPGPNLYGTLLQNMADSFVECLAE